MYIVSAKERIEEWIKIVEKINQNSIEVEELDLTIGGSDTSPSEVIDILESLGYNMPDPLDWNGWEQDFDGTFCKEGARDLRISGSGYYFTLVLDIRRY